MFAAILLAELTLFLGLTQTGSGDSTRLVGRVTQDSQPAPGAVVVATSDSDVRSTVADAHGRYAFMTLLPGVYTLTTCQPHGGKLFTISNPSQRPVPLALRASPIDAGDNFVELSAGVEYLANLNIRSNCIWH